MKRFMKGRVRSQGSLLPECQDAFVGEGNAVRVLPHHAAQIGFPLSRRGWEIHQSEMALRRPILSQDARTDA